MIRVVTEGPPIAGLFRYRIEWRRKFAGVSPTPLLDACVQLNRIGLMPDTVVGLFKDGDEELIARTTVGQGNMAITYARQILEGTMNGPKNGPVGEHLVKDATGRPIATATDPAPLAAVTTPAPATAAPPATPEAPPPPQRKRPKRPAGKHPAHAKPKKSAQSPHKRKPIASGGRRGGSRGR
jgi:hypothetical protein